MSESYDMGVAALALFVRFVRLNEDIPEDDPMLAEVFVSYVKTAASILIPEPGE